MIPPECGNGIEFGFLDFFKFFFNFHIYLVSSPNDELDKHKEKYNLNLILMTNSSYFLLTILLKNYWKKNHSS